MQKHIQWVSAPAGYGKTSLVSTWLDQVDRPSAWLTLDEEDNDPARFLTHLIATLRQVDVAGTADVGCRTLAILQNPQQVAPELVMTHLLSDITNLQGSLILVLDDFQYLASEPIWSFSRRLLLHPPPTLHLVIVSRHALPGELARLRAHGEISEIGTADLRFSQAESQDFICRVMDLDLDQPTLQQLYTQTEGWVAALQLAALSLNQGTEAGLFDDFSGTHPHMMDYLAAEVLQQAPEQQREFLLRTSILAELSAGCCAAVLGRPYTTAVCQQLLRSTVRRNLFLLPLDNKNEWFRFHPLLREFLQTQLKHTSHQSQLAEAHGRAAGWFKQHNFKTQAIRHYLAAGNHAAAAELIQEVALDAWQRGDFATLRYWFSHLPEQFIRQQIQLCLIYAWVLSFDGKFKQSGRWLEIAEKNAGTSDTHALFIVFSILLSQPHQSHPFRKVSLVEQALADIEAGHPQWRAVALVASSYTARHEGNIDLAERRLYEAINKSRQGGSDYLELLVGFNMVNFLLSQCKFQGALDTSQALLKRGQESPMRMFWLATVYNMLGDIHLNVNHLQAAERHFSLALTFGRQLGRLASQVNALYGLFWLSKLTANSNNVLAQFETIETFWRSHPEFNRNPMRAAYQALMALEKGHINEVDHWLSNVRLTPTESSSLYSQRLEYLIWSLLQLSRGKTGAGEAIPVLKGLQAAIRQLHQPRFLVEVEALLCGALTLQGELDLALETLQEAINNCGDDLYQFAFLIVGRPLQSILEEAHKRGGLTDQMRVLIGSFEKNKMIAGINISQTQPLSERERELLALVAVGVTNKQAAQELHISLNTVKAHLKRINKKLDVSNRTAAVAKAQELGLI